jgi:RNA polymerase sigma-70 factor, ECF subfamily
MGSSSIYTILHPSNSISSTFTQNNKTTEAKLVNMHVLNRVNASNFEQWFSDYYDGMFRYCQTMIKDQDEAEDIIQSVFMDIWKDRESLEIHSSIQAYLYKGVYFKCMNKIKSEKVAQKYVHQKSDAYSHGDPAIYEEVASLIDEGINALPEQCRKIFLLSRFEGLRYNEIAIKLNLSPKTIENQMGKALKTMRAALSEYLQIIVVNILIHLQ